MGSSPRAPEAPFSLPGVGRIPLRDRYGKVRAHATVDLADFKRITQHRWHLGSGGYAVRCIRPIDGPQRKLSMHREVMGLGYGDPGEVDHVAPARKLDNRRSNIRLATRDENAQNLPSYAGKTSRHRGVSYDSRNRRWLAQAFCGEKKLRTAFRTEEEAHAAVVAWRAEHMPFATD